MADLPRLIDLHLAGARADERGRSAEVLVHDGPLRQSILALTSGTELGEHNSPDAASLQVLVGRVQVTGLEPAVVGTGQLVVLTHRRHAVVALEDAVFLLTAVTGVGQATEAARRG